MKRHMKLSDVEANTNYVIPRIAATFERAYPTIETIRVEVRPYGVGFEPYLEQKEVLYVYGKDSMVPIINCRNPRCYGGGLNLDWLLRWSVIGARQTEYETVIDCGGYEGSPKGRGKDGPCDTRFRVKISVTHKEPSA